MVATEKRDHFPGWLVERLAAEDLEVWGAADLAGLETPRDATGIGFPRAISWAVPMDPEIMASIRNGPNALYAEAYVRVNARINALALELTREIMNRGFRARPLAASERSDPVGIRGEFPHKTAATRAGLGWIGAHCQLVTRRFGPWVRLGTVFTDLALPCGPAVERSFCGRCRRCVEACPAGALKGTAWKPGLPREEILDAAACDRWKKQHYAHLHRGHVCGICSAACPFGLRLFRRKRIPGN